jgi:hypothetical protein
MSAQLDAYLAARFADGLSLEDAAFDSGLSIAEARLTDAAVERGEIQAPQPPQQPKEITVGGKAKTPADEVEEIKKPDFSRAIQVMKSTIRPAEEESAGARGDLSAAWKIVEDECHINKKAAKDFHRLSNMSDELRDDYLRSLYGLMQEAGIGISQDLVDQMGDGEAPSMPVKARSKGFGTEGLAALN